MWWMGEADEPGTGAKLAALLVESCQPIVGEGGRGDVEQGVLRPGLREQIALDEATRQPLSRSDALSVVDEGWDLLDASGLQSDKSGGHHAEPTRSCTQLKKGVVWSGLGELEDAVHRGQRCLSIGEAHAFSTDLPGALPERDLKRLTQPVVPGEREVRSPEIILEVAGDQCLDIRGKLVR